MVVSAQKMFVDIAIFSIKIWKKRSMILLSMVAMGHGPGKSMIRLSSGCLTILMRKNLFSFLFRVRVWT